LDHVFLPLETAIARQDDVAHLLIALDTGYNTTIRSAKHEDEPQMSILDWVQSAVDYREKNRDLSVTPAPELNTEPEAIGWKRYLIDLVLDWQVKEKECESKAKRLSSGRNDADPQEVIEYLQGLERALVAKGAESWNAQTPLSLSKPAMSTQPPKERLRYHTIERYGMRRVLPDYQAKLYEELFEACFVGDNQKVQKMCFPPTGSSVVPLSIFVHTSDCHGKLGQCLAFLRVTCSSNALHRIHALVRSCRWAPLDNCKVDSSNSCRTVQTKRRSKSVQFEGDKARW